MPTPPLQKARPGAGPTKSSTGRSAQDVTPNYGSQKYRVGVQIKSGAYVPAGTTTAGTQLTVTDTPLDGTPTTFTCTTDASTAVAGSTATYCIAAPSVSAASAFDRARTLDPQLTTGPTPIDAPSTEMFFAAPGDTITIAQTSTEPGLVADPSTATLGPCLATVSVPEPICFDFTNLTPVATDEVFDDIGLPPTATNDTVTDVQPNPVDINVLANDDAAGAPLTLSVTGQPAHGTATVDASPTVSPTAAVRTAAAPAAVGPNITYTPDPGFLGTDTFTYQLATANGTATATVSVHVVAPPPTAVDDTATTPSATPVTVHVTANDSAHGGGAITVDSVGNPAHGTATVSGDNVIYTPSAGFVGTDTFTYRISTPYGSAQATVTVTVTAGGTLAGTGVESEQLVSIGGALLLTGGVAVAAGRRRRRPLA